MSRSKAPKHRVRRYGPALASALLVACLVGLSATAPRTDLQQLAALHDSAPLQASAQGSGTAVNARRLETKAVAEKAPGAAARFAPAVPVAPNLEDAKPAASPTEAAYRYMGRMAANEGETSVVLFGRGRVITLQGPGPVDDEYAVEALFDDYLVLRHRPSGSGSWVPLTRHQKPGSPPQDPELQARD